MATKRQNTILKIVKNHPVCPGYYEIIFNAPNIARASHSGQFCLISVPGVFLRRPFSIYSAKNGRLSFLYKVIGKGTEALSKMKPGASMTVLGPLGNGYDKNQAKGMSPVFVAGGTGVASLNFLCAELKRGELFYGGRTKKDIICLDDFKKNKIKLNISTQDGSKGAKGLVTDLLDEYLGCITGKKDVVIYACGPHGMQKKVAELAEKHNVPGFVSMEEMMGCGVGNCQGCAIKIDNTYKMVCKDGPVFGINEINW